MFNLPTYELTTQPSIQPNIQTNSLTPINTNQQFRGPKVKLSFPELDCKNPKGWIGTCEFFIFFFCELYQVSADEKMSYVAMHIKEKMDTWFDVYMMEQLLGRLFVWTYVVGMAI